MRKFWAEEKRVKLLSTHTIRLFVVCYCNHYCCRIWVHFQCGIKLCKVNNCTRAHFMISFTGNTWREIILKAKSLIRKKITLHSNDIVIIITITISFDNITSEIILEVSFTLGSKRISFSYSICRRVKQTNIELAS